MTNSDVSIEDVPISRFHQLLTVRSGGGSFVDGYVLSIIGVAMSQMSVGPGADQFLAGHDCGLRPDGYLLRRVLRRVVD